MKYISDPSNENLMGFCVSKVVNVIGRAWDETKSAHIVITGGRTGLCLAKALDQVLFNLLRERETFGECWLHIWFSDERFVTYDDPDRNDSALIAAFTQCQSNIVFHRVEQVEDLDKAAAGYSLDLESSLKKRPFDAVMLSMGEDGHIASLFPGLFDPEFASAALAVHNSPKLPPLRVSISLVRLADAKRIFIFVLGEGKAAALQSIATSPVGLLQKSSLNGQIEILTDLSVPTGI